jgi:hypothetical protein
MVESDELLPLYEKVALSIPKRHTCAGAQINKGFEKSRSEINLDQNP